jgi:hypothetical protein
LRFPGCSEVWKQEFIKTHFLHASPLLLFSYLFPIVPNDVLFPLLTFIRIFPLPIPSRSSPRRSQTT